MDALSQEQIEEWIDSLSLQGIKDWAVDNPEKVAIILLLIIGIMMFLNTLPKS